MNDIFYQTIIKLILFFCLLSLLNGCPHENSKESEQPIDNENPKPADNEQAIPPEQKSHSEETIASTSNGETTEVRSRSFSCTEFVHITHHGESKSTTHQETTGCDEFFGKKAPKITPPEMVNINAGSFQMGEYEEENTNGNKSPHIVLVDKFAIGVKEVTFAEYDIFAEVTKREKPDDYGWGRGDRPVINVSWHDAVAYAKWLGDQTGEKYRLPTEAEWEYAARGCRNQKTAEPACTDNQYWWGDQMDSNQANCHGCGDQWDKKTSPVGSFEKNPFGLYDTAGNVWEWTCSEYEKSYSGKEVSCVNEIGESTQFAVRGGSWYSIPKQLGSGYRFKRFPSERYNEIGFRLVMEFE